MLDIKLIRDNPDVVRKDLKKRGDVEKGKLLDELIETDKKWRAVLGEVEALKAKRNKVTEEIAQLKKANKEKEAKKKIEEMNELAEKIKILDEKARILKEHIERILLRLPNILHESVPIGKDDTENVEIKKWGKPPKFDFQPKNHLEIAKSLGLIDEERGSKVAGRGFLFLKNELVLLDFALMRFATDFLLKKGFVLYEPPFMVGRKTYEGMIGDPTDFAEASYKIEGEDFYLIPTAEYPLGGIFMNESFNKKDLPIKLCGVSPCFRKEVGTHGKYTKGLFRMHHFNKVEQFVFCLPEDSWKFHEEIQKNTEELYQGLGLHFRVVNVCTGDIGTKAAKKYDTEVWMADGKFREVGSNSNCTDYQARRLNIKFREKTGSPPVGFVHTLNNTALATSRTMIAILEQFQQKDGSVLVPKVLQPYCGFKKIEAKK